MTPRTRKARWVSGKSLGLYDPDAGNAMKQGRVTVHKKKKAREWWVCEDCLRAVDPNLDVLGKPLQCYGYCHSCCFVRVREVKKARKNKI